MVRQTFTKQDWACDLSISKLLPMALNWMSRCILFLQNHSRRWVNVDVPLEVFGHSDTDLFQRVSQKKMPQVSKQQTRLVEFQSMSYSTLPNQSINFVNRNLVLLEVARLSVFQRLLVCWISTCRLVYLSAHLSGWLSVCLCELRLEVPLWTWKITVLCPL